MTRRGAARAPALATLLVLTLWGCGGGPEDSARTSGPLAAGFEIEPGSALMGEVFPFGDEGLRVILRVDGDMESVFEGYVRQAAELGYPVGASPGRPDGQWCSDDPADWNTHRSDAEAFDAECSAYGSDPYGPDHWQMTLRGLVEPDGRGYLELSGGRYSGESAFLPSLDDGPVAPLTDDEVAPGLAVMEEEPPVRLVEGSELLFDPLPSVCATGGYVAMLRVTGDLLPVMRGYEEQFTGMTAFTTEGLVGSDDEPRVWASAAGGGDLSAVGVAGDPSYVLIERCND